MNKTETIVLGGGCFWCIEAVFKMLRGIVLVTSGYAGGTTENPTYEQVCSGKTDHAEVVKIEYDPAVIPLIDLLEIFFHLHDPTTPNRQGNDIGTQYRSIILHTKEEQKEISEKIIKSNPDIVTEVKPLTKFYPAEQYHKDYYAKNTSQPYCRFIIDPKLRMLREKYSDKIQ